MYVEKVNTKSPSLNYQLNDRLTRKGNGTTSNEFLMPNKALLCLLDIFVSSQCLFAWKALGIDLAYSFCYTCLYVCA